MDAQTALTRLAAEEKLVPEHFAIATGKSVWAVGRWMTGESDPKITDIQKIARSYPRLWTFLAETAAA